MTQYELVVRLALTRQSRSRGLKNLLNLVGLVHPDKRTAMHSAKIIAVHKEVQHVTVNRAQYTRVGVIVL